MQVLRQLPLFFPGHAVFAAGGTRKPRLRKKPGDQPEKQPVHPSAQQAAQQAAIKLSLCPGHFRDRVVRKKRLLKEQMLVPCPEKATPASQEKAEEKATEEKAMEEKPAEQNSPDQNSPDLPVEGQDTEQPSEGQTPEEQIPEKQNTEEQHMKELITNNQQQEIQRGKSQRGFTLIEVLGALVVGSLVFGFAAFAISKAIESARVTSFNENLALLRINIHEVYASSRGFGSSSATAKDITSALTEAGAIPDPWLDKDSNTAVHTLGGGVSIEGTLTNFTISAKDITQDACRKIASSQKENWDKVTINGETVDTVPTSLCSSDDAGTGTNTMAFTAH